MKWTLLFVVSVLTQQIFAATLNCNLSENKVSVASFSAPVSIPGQVATFQFTQQLDGKEFSSEVGWDKDIITMKLHHKASGLDIVKTDMWNWERPFEGSFYSKFGTATISCSLNFDDGYNQAWIFFRKLLGTRADAMKANLDLVLTAAKAPETNPSELAEKTNAICYLIGTINEVGTTQDFFQQLVSLGSSYYSAKVFPEADGLFSKLQQQFLDLHKYCFTGEGNTNYQNTAALKQNVQFSKDYIDFILAFFDKRFPNNGTFGK